jgi:hypothetical protein
VRNVVTGLRRGAVTLAVAAALLGPVAGFVGHPMVPLPLRLAWFVVAFVAAVAPVPSFLAFVAGGVLLPVVPALAGWPNVSLMEQWALALLENGALRAAWRHDDVTPAPSPWAGVLAALVTASAVVAVAPLTVAHGGALELAGKAALFLRAEYVTGSSQRHVLASVASWAVVVEEAGGVPGLRGGWWRRPAVRQCWRRWPEPRRRWRPSGSGSGGRERTCSRSPGAMRSAPATHQRDVHRCQRPGRVSRHADAGGAVARGRGVVDGQARGLAARRRGAPGGKRLHASRVAWVAAVVGVLLTLVWTVFQQGVVAVRAERLAHLRRCGLGGRHRRDGLAGRPHRLGHDPRRPRSSRSARISTPCSRRSTCARRSPSA